MWLIPELSRLKSYEEVLRRMRAGGILLDVGCFIGHDLRRLVQDGASGENMYGVDIVNHWDIGFEMFGDKDEFQAHFVEADISSTSPHATLAGLKGCVDVVVAQQFLHLWDWDGQD